ncbi:glycosyltransferase [Azospirillum sp. HJ39]|uniref:glycosyltransferase n=1 Tax=Azospirillum sp. HJ39 TaxID=3159496 RepID=UPI0035568298
MTPPSFSLVFNLDPGVTWAASLDRCAARSGIPRLATPEDDRTGTVVYLGDRLPPRGAVRRELYFLAACSLPPNDDEGDWAEEAANIARVGAVLLVSASERDKLVAAGSPPGKLHVVGAPLQVLTDPGPAAVRRVRRRVCFIGQLRPIKNPALEVEVVRTLRSHGYDCVHIGWIDRDWRDRLERAGAQIVTESRWEAYLEAVAHCGFYVATSFSESLCLSALEAVALGCVPVVPDHSGFRDWCPARYRYTALTVQSAVERLLALDAAGESGPGAAALDHYHPHRFFGRIDALARGPLP